MRFHVVGLGLRRSFARFVIGVDQRVFAFQLRAQFGQNFEISVRCVDGVTHRTDFVDDEVDVQVVGVVVDDGDPLVVGVAESLGCRRRDFTETIRVWTFAIGEG